MINEKTSVWKVGTDAWIPLINSDLKDNVVSAPELPASQLIDTFSNEKNPIGRVIVIAFAILSIIGATTFFLPFVNVRFSQETWLAAERSIFFVYASSYAAMWLVYFLSKKDNSFFSVATLRRLLLTTSIHWDDAANQTKHEIEKGYQEKARISITAMAMLVAASLIELSQANSIYLHLIKEKQGLSVWHLSMLCTAVISAFTALVCFLVSADTLDSLFNRFRSPRLTHRLMHHFYNTNINPRYHGVVLLINGVIFLIAVHSPLLASLACATFMAVGFGHWFPWPFLIKDNPQELSLSRKFFVRYVALMIIPTVLIFLKIVSTQS